MIKQNFIWRTIKRTGVKFWKIFFDFLNFAWSEEGSISLINRAPLNFWLFGSNGSQSIFYSNSYIILTHINSTKIWIPWSGTLERYDFGQKFCRTRNLFELFKLSWSNILIVLVNKRTVLTNLVDACPFCVGWLELQIFLNRFDVAA